MYMKNFFNLFERVEENWFMLMLIFDFLSDFCKGVRFFLV